MAKPMTAAQWRAQAKKWRIDWNEYSGWTTRTRPGTFAPVGVVIHHTGSDSGQNSTSYDHFLFVEGRPAEGIPGPLCHAADEMDGDLIQGAIGRANHAGSGSGAVLRLVQADKAPLDKEIRPGADDTNGNGWFYGIEVKFDGGQPMTAKQYDTAVRWAAAICDFHGWTAGSVIGHKEWSSRKPDPGSTFMAKFRRDVAHRLKVGPVDPVAVTPPPVVKPPVVVTPEDDMPYTEAELRALAGQGVHGQRIGRSTITIGLALETLYRNSAENEAAVAELKTEVTAVKAELDELKGLLTQAIAALPKA